MTARPPPARKGADVDPERLRELLAAVQGGRVSLDQALERLRRLPYEDLGFARLDTHRALRSGAPEAVYCPGKTPEQVVGILARLAESHRQGGGVPAQQQGTPMEGL